MSEASSLPTDTRAHGSVAGRILGTIGLVLHCTVVGYLYLVSGLVVPWYGLFVLFVVWLVLLFQGIRWLRGPRPALAFAVPFIAMAFWAFVLIVGGTLFHWTA